MLERGWLAHYTNRRYGYGLLPDTFEAYKRQRQRWAFGGFQIVCKHWRHMLPRSRTLSREQKREYGLGWLNWLGAESIGVVVALLNIVWVPVVAFANIAVPDKVLTLPILAAFVGVGRAFRRALPAAGARLACRRCSARSARPCRCNGRSRARLAPARSRERLPFLRTAKGGATRKGRLPGILGSRDRRAVADRRGHSGGDELQAGARDQYLRAGAGGAEPAVPRRRWRSPPSKARASTRSPTGAASKPALPNCCRGRKSPPKRRSCRPRTASRRRSKRNRSSPRRRGPVYLL